MNKCIDKFPLAGKLVLPSATVTHTYGQPLRPSARANEPDARHGTSCCLITPLNHIYHRQMSQSARTALRAAAPTIKTIINPLHYR